ncbi:MAG: hypothetical protein WBA46_09515 [Thermomicrobiales bacterium]
MVALIRPASHHLDTARWAVMGDTYTVPCLICRHHHNPDYSHEATVGGKPIRICPECNQELRTGDALTLIDLIYDEQYD